MDNLGHSLWHQQAHMPSAKAGRIVITSGHGAWLTTSDGRQLLDTPAGLWHANIGHGREEIALAAADQIRKLETYHTFGRFTNEPALRLADRIASMSPIPDGKVMLTSGGSDSVELACKLARRHWQLHGHPERRFILSRDHAYHGLHTFGTSITGLPYNREGYGTESLVPETARIDTHDIAVVRRQIEALGPDKVAAVIAEPVVGTGGVFGPTEGYFAGLQEMAQEFGFLLIADEVITGFGRCGTMFGCERYGITPDIVTMAKGLTSGYAALGAVVVAPTVAEAFFAGPDSPMFRHGLTYSGHATACVIAEANLDIVEREGLVTRAAELEGLLVQALAPLAGHRCVAELRTGSGFLAGVRLADGVSGDVVSSACIDEGIVMRLIHDNTLHISPPFVVTYDEVALIGSTVLKVLDTYAEGVH